MLRPPMQVWASSCGGVLRQGRFRLGPSSRPETNRQVPSWAPRVQSPSDRIVAVAEGCPGGPRGQGCGGRRGHATTFLRLRRAEDPRRRRPALPTNHARPPIALMPLSDDAPEESGTNKVEEHAQVVMSITARPGLDRYDGSTAAGPATEEGPGPDTVHGGRPARAFGQSCHMKLRLHEPASAEIGKERASPISPGHHTHTRVDHVHTIFGRTNHHQPLPRAAGRSEPRRKSSRNPGRSCQHHNPKA
jgi:hypothetical protein